MLQLERPAVAALRGPLPAPPLGERAGIGARLAAPSEWFGDWPLGVAQAGNVPRLAPLPPSASARVTPREFGHGHLDHHRLVPSLGPPAAAFPPETGDLMPNAKRLVREWASGPAREDRDADAARAGTAPGQASAASPRRRLRRTVKLLAAGGVMVKPKTP